MNRFEFGGFHGKVFSKELANTTKCIFSDQLFYFFIGVSAKIQNYSLCKAIVWVEKNKKPNLL